MTLLDMGLGSGHRKVPEFFCVVSVQPQRYVGAALRGRGAIASSNLHDVSVRPDLARNVVIEIEWPFGAARA